MKKEEVKTGKAIFLTKESLLTKRKLKIEEVDLGDNEFVYVKQMTAKEKDTMEQSLVKITKKGRKTDYEANLTNFKAKLAVCTLCDDEGNKILAFNDFNLLSESISAEMMEKIIDVAQKLNGITEEDKEDLVKN